MTKGTVKAKVHPVFTQRLDQLAQVAEQNAKVLKAEEDFRLWLIPKNLSAKDLFDIPNLHKQDFDRTEINTNYVECFKEASAMGTVADVISLKHQIDYVAAEERAFRFRHASVCRCIGHMGARRFFQGTGPLFEYIKFVEEKTIQAGGVE